MLKVLYFDKVFPAMTAMIEEVKPPDIHIDCYYNLDEKAKQAAIAQAEYFLVALHKVTKEMMQSANNLKLIQKTGIGVDNIDTEAAKGLGIPVANTPGGNATSVAELTIGMILSLYRKLHMVNQATKTGHWLSFDVRPTSYEMKGKIHGILGFGNIGREVARLSQAFGTRILYYDLHRVSPDVENKLAAEYVSIDELLQAADIISLHLPLTQQTRNCIGERELNLMKDHAVLVNVSRGHIVDEAALYRAMKQNRLLGAAIDTWSREPAGDNPLLTLDNVLATPHIGAGTRDAMQSVLQIAFSNIEKVASNAKPEYVVNGIS